MKKIQIKGLKEEDIVTEFIAKPSPKTIVFGELHTQADRNRINRHILRIREAAEISYILSEEIGPHIYRTNSEKEKAIRDQMYSTGPESLNLAIRLDVPIVGIDDWSEKDHSDTPGTFAIREKQMMQVITKYHGKGVVCVIIGDTHLRESKTVELGDASPLSHLKSRNGFTVMRSPASEIL